MFGDWPTGEGEMAARIRAFDWSTTPLGPIATWPESLRVTVANLLASGFPGVVLWGEDLVQIYNDGYRGLLGRKHPAGLGQSARECSPDVCRANGSIYDRVRGGETLTVEDELLPVTRSGELTDAWFTLSYSPVHGDRGVAGVLVTVFDTTSRMQSDLAAEERAERLRVLSERWARAEAALRESDQRFRQFADAATDLLWIRDAETLRWEFLSPSFQQLYGLPVDEALSGDPLATCNDLVAPADRNSTMAALHKVAGGEQVTFEFRIQRPDTGELRWVRNTAFPVRDAAGRVRRIGGVAHDVTEEKEATRHQAMLLAELQHRTRNLLGVIRSMARRTAETSEDIESFLTHFDGRLSAIARTQTAMSRNNEVSAGLDDMILEEFLAAAGAEQVTLEGPEVQLNGKVAESISLAVHELVTNALKYGALTTPKGHVYVTWELMKRAGQTVLALTWRETGVGVIDVRPQRMGFGRRLLEKALPYELGAETTLLFAPGGVVASIEVPLAGEP